MLLMLWGDDADVYQVWERRSWCYWSEIRVYRGDSGSEDLWEEITAMIEWINKG